MSSWITRVIEGHPQIHRGALALWRLVPPRRAGLLKGMLARNWLVGAVAVMVDHDGSPPEIRKFGWLTAPGGWFVKS